ncbi:MAG: metal ABC transporter permease, partial [Gemmatimonadetes bacterium]|nr:metal ABC transporter permease [Gemmatimonadota bacterium]NIS00781.1 metal ABC transporter permease [Gemmatimonadota bacterium]NIT66858.1 metal ABC transporter permease [Gemmatimonadota bacterium]NIU54759.1 metal ABC transporter permease [Gemmatimonadota bacterium]NIV22956.1 metal ABC transporter permease [Gemmatimonadota bacterium]
RFFTISMNPEEARRRGWSVKLWDFVFYALFGVVVTSSVAIAGVLLVFSFLVIPAVIAFLFTVQPGKLLAIAWSTGTF